MRGHVWRLGVALAACDGNVTTDTGEPPSSADLSAVLDDLAELRDELNQVRGELADARERPAAVEAPGGGPAGGLVFLASSTASTRTSPPARRPRPWACS